VFQTLRAPIHPLARESLCTFVARGRRVEPIFLSAVAPSYEEMKLPRTVPGIRHLLPSFSSSSTPTPDTPPTLFRFYHVRATDRMFTLPRPEDARVRFHLVAPRVSPSDIHLGEIQ